MAMRGYFYTGPDQTARDFEAYVTEETGEAFRLPTSKVVCGRCHGEGVHDAWDGGMTASEMDEQGPEFFEDYMAGHYDRTCEECHGKNVVDEVDRERMSAEVLAAWDAYCGDVWASNAESAMERAMGC